MYRSVVALLLLPSVLLTQLAALGHSHSGSQPAGDHLRPHFHTRPAAPHHDHGHHHHGPDGHHHYHDDGDTPAEAEAVPTPQPKPLSENEHDSDAIFLDRVEAVVNIRSDLGIQASLNWVAIWPCLHTDIPADRVREAVFQTHGPPSRGHHCPIYIWQLTLLI